MEVEPLWRPHDQCHTEQGKISSPFAQANDLQRGVVVGTKSTPGTEVGTAISTGR